MKIKDGIILSATIEELKENYKKENWDRYISLKEYLKLSMQSCIKIVGENDDRSTTPDSIDKLDKPSC